MPCSIHFYQDQVLDEGRGTLKSARRIVYCSFGEVTINGEALSDGHAVFVGEDAKITGKCGWSQLWRWEVDLPHAERPLIRGDGVLTLHRMSRVIGMLDMDPGTEWLFRLDQITAPPGRVTDPHKHPGPGIRCLVEGTFNISQDVESYRAINPGEPWWECGEQPVIAWGSKSMHARFLRGTVMPTDNAGQTDTIKNKAGQPNKKRGQHRLLVDHVITAPESI